MNIRMKMIQTALAVVLLVTVWFRSEIQPAQSAGTPFNVAEAMIDGVQEAYKEGTLTAHQLTPMYPNRIDAYDKHGTTINSVITINSKALEEAERIDGQFKRTGKFVGSLHGINLTYGYEQVTHHRIPPKTTPPLGGVKSN